MKALFAAVVAEPDGEIDGEANSLLILLESQ